MLYRERTQDLFEMSEDYHLVHCISSDFALGAGIAVEFNKRYNMREVLTKHYPKYEESFEEIGGDCLLEGRVMNLVTKKHYWQKPTYESITKAIEKLREVCLSNGIDKIAMPLIGCGLDRLDWIKVSSIIQQVFGNTEIEIVVCKR